MNYMFVDILAPNSALQIGCKNILIFFFIKRCQYLDYIRKNYPKNS